MSPKKIIPGWGKMSGRPVPRSQGASLAISCQLSDEPATTTFGLRPLKPRRTRVAGAPRSRGFRNTWRRRPTRFTGETSECQIPQRVLSKCKICEMGEHPPLTTAAKCGKEIRGLNARSRLLSNIEGLATGRLPRFSRRARRSG